MYIEEKINYRTACTSDTFCAKLVRATSVRLLPKCRPMIVYKKEKLPHFFELHLLELVVYSLIPIINFRIKKWTTSFSENIVIGRQ